MNVTSGPPFQHRPYDGSSQPFAVGLKPVGEENWLEPDSNLVDHLAEKERLIASDLDVVFRAEPDTDGAQDEILRLIIDNLKRFHFADDDVGSGEVGILKAGRTVPLSATPALLAAARLVQEDLVIMRKGADGYRLAAAVLCFPSSWSLTEKFGQSMTGIHETVPGFNGSRMGNMVARIFDNLTVDQILCRYNWSIYPDHHLHHPEARQVSTGVGDAMLARLFLRVERQTLRRLPENGDILFTIKIHHDPLSALAAQEDQSKIAGQLRQQLVALDSAQLAYKGLAECRDGLAKALEVVAYHAND